MISFSNIRKQYKKDLFRPSPLALQKITFQLSKGQTLGLIGANGAGKSTAIKLLMDFIRPDEGSIELFGQSNKNYTTRDKIGYLPEIASFPPNLTIIDLINFTGNTCRLEKSLRRERSDKLLDDLGLWDARKKYLRDYSKGMQQRGNFVLALLNNPELLILDEPMSGLDPLGRELIIRLIENLKVEGKTILFCSHILNDVDRLVDQVLVLHKGENLYFGTPEKFIESYNVNNIEKAFITLLREQDEKKCN